MKKLISLFLITTIISCFLSKPCNALADDSSSVKSEIQKINEEYDVTTTFVDLEDIDSSKAIVFETTQEYEDFLANIQSNQHPIIYQDISMSKISQLQKSASYSVSRQANNGWTTDGQTHLSDVAQYQISGALPFVVNCVFTYTSSYYFYSDRFRFDSISGITSWITGFQGGLNASWEQQASNYIYNSNQSQVTIEIIGTVTYDLIIKGIGTVATTNCSPTFVFNAR